jgi:hypothetical protein
MRLASVRGEDSAIPYSPTLIGRIWVIPEANNPFL